MVTESWMRSAAAGVRVDQTEAPITITSDALRDYREAHPLSRVFPLLEDVLGDAARASDALMAVSDEHGQLLWVYGTPETLRRAENIGFVEGSSWDERVAGTNAPGTALALGRPVEVVRAEHFRSSVQPWSCAAAPIHDLGSGALLGVLDVTGGDQIVVPQTMAMVRAAARLAEVELARAPFGSHAAHHEILGASAQVSIEALGRQESLVGITAGGTTRPLLRVSRRHSEVLVLLAETPDGLTGDALSVLLYEGNSRDSTVRAELGRLRQMLGDDLLVSRPYRLRAHLTTDWGGVEAHVASGDIQTALRSYRGPLLAGSSGPGIVAARERVHHTVRQAVLRSGRPDLMSTWTRSAWGVDDYEMWQALGRAIPVGSPLSPLVQGQLARLDLDLA